MERVFEGIFPALVTPMTAEDEVDYATLGNFVNYLIENGGVHGLIPLGSTGEYYALSPDEREAVVRATRFRSAAGAIRWLWRAFLWGPSVG